MSLPNMTPQQLLSAARFLVEHMPDAVLVKNQVGNLTAVGADDYELGWVDLRTGEVTCYECENTDGEPATSLSPDAQ